MVEISVLPIQVYFIISWTHCGQYKVSNQFMILPYFLFETRSWTKTLVRKGFREGLVKILSLLGMGHLILVLSSVQFIAGPAWTCIPGPYTIKSIPLQWPQAVRPCFLYLLCSKREVSFDLPVLSVQPPISFSTPHWGQKLESSKAQRPLLVNSICVSVGFKPFLEHLQCCGLYLGKPSYYPFVLESPWTCCPPSWVSRHDPCVFTFLLAYSRFLNFYFQT